MFLRRCARRNVDLNWADGVSGGLYDGGGVVIFFGYGYLVDVRFRFVHWFWDFEYVHSGVHVHSSCDLVYRVKELACW